MISEAMLEHVKSKLDKIFEYLYSIGYQKGKDWTSKLSNTSDLNCLIFFKSVELSTPVRIQCTISASVITNQSIPEWLVGVNLEPYNAVLEAFSFFETSDLGVVMETFHSEMDQSFINFIHSEKVEELDRNIDASVHGWIHALSHELNQDITGKNRRPGRPKIIDEYW